MNRPVLAAVTALSAAIALGSAVAAANVTDGYCLTYRAPADTTGQTLDDAANMLHDRLGSMGIAADATSDPTSLTIAVGLQPGPTDLDAPTDLATGLDAKGDLRFIPDPESCPDEVVEGAPPPDCLAEVPPLFDGSAVAYANVDEDVVTGEVFVNIELDGEAARRNPGNSAARATRYGVPRAPMSDTCMYPASQGR